MYISYGFMRIGCSFRKEGMLDYVVKEGVADSTTMLENFVGWVECTVHLAYCTLFTFKLRSCSSSLDITPNIAFFLILLLTCISRPDTYVWSIGTAYAGE